jgi:hypothetical protein
MVLRVGMDGGSCQGRLLFEEVVHRGQHPAGGVGSRATTADR